MAAVHPIRGIGISEQLLILDAPDKYILHVKPGFVKQPVHTLLGIPQVIMATGIVHRIHKGKTDVQVPVVPEQQVQVRKRHDWVPDVFHDLKTKRYIEHAYATRDIGIVGRAERLIQVGDNMRLGLLSLESVVKNYIFLYVPGSNLAFDRVGTASSVHYSLRPDANRCQPGIQLLSKERRPRVEDLLICPAQQAGPETTQVAHYEPPLTSLIREMPVIHRVVTLRSAVKYRRQYRRDPETFSGFDRSPCLSLQRGWGGKEPGQ